MLGTLSEKPRSSGSLWPIAATPIRRRRLHHGQGPWCYAGAITRDGRNSHGREKSRRGAYNTFLLQTLTAKKAARGMPRSLSSGAGIATGGGRKTFKTAQRLHSGARRGDRVPCVIALPNPDGTNAEAFCDLGIRASFRIRSKRRSATGMQPAANPHLTRTSLTKE